MVIVTPRFAEKHDYKYNITDKYGVDPTDMEHLVLPAAPGLGKNPGAEHYGAGGVADNRDFSNPMYDMGGGGGSAVLAPSSVQHASPALSGTGDTKQPRELSPVTIDTGKDTQCLVAEDDSEC